MSDLNVGVSALLGFTCGLVLCAAFAVGCMLASC